ncbi:hypothetical protein L873DRAFT_1265089 [Choiromyces venosus 120613-1]|uniref:Secreted protein n=1 Tax=Choiromyces venosus 120613-1 TaxID=1336337 RepID=A0A3N4JPZ8_9PEZI|nr:hypothetical protein L873DRAFT_1265089 [Choiromyces venosus 120613-1]
MNRFFFLFFPSLLFTSTNPIVETERQFTSGNSPSNRKTNNYPSIFVLSDTTEFSVGGFHFFIFSILLLYFELTHSKVRYRHPMIYPCMYVCRANHSIDKLNLTSPYLTLPTPSSAQTEIHQSHPAHPAQATIRQK